MLGYYSNTTEWKCICIYKHNKQQTSADEYHALYFTARLKANRSRIKLFYNERIWYIFSSLSSVLCTQCVKETCEEGGYHMPLWSIAKKVLAELPCYLLILLYVISSSLCSLECVLYTGYEACALRLY